MEIRVSRQKDNCHNPYFNRWFSAIMLGVYSAYDELGSQSLF